jgi:Zn-dependent protease with chaperone function
MNATSATPNLFQRLHLSLQLDAIKESPYGLRPQFTRYPRATIMALLGSWSLFAFAIWVAAWAAFIGAIVGFVGTANLAQTYVPGSGSAAGVLGAVLGAVAGFAFGFVVVFGDGIAVASFHVLISLVSGAILASVATAFMITIEPWIMYFHGYRPPSHREERILMPVLRDVARAMRLRHVPQLLIADTTTPGAWTHCRHIVVSKRLLDLPHDELAGILIHELRHWLSGDTAGLLYVSMAGLPITLSINLLSRFRKAPTPVVALVFTLALWPFLLIPKFFIMPLLAMEGRDKEYKADAAATNAGYGPGLIRALEQLRPFEQARSGWEAVLHATHPPMEYRIEAIEEDLARMAPKEPDSVGRIFSRDPEQTAVEPTPIS